MVAGASNLIVVDLDTTKTGGRDGVWERWKKWCADHGLPVYQPHVSTARQGMHIYFKLPPGFDSSKLSGHGIAEGIEIKCGNGYTIAPGSYYDGTAKGEASGGYAFFTDAPAPHEAPQALIDHCSAPARKPRAKPPERKIGYFDFNDALALYQWCAAYRDAHPEDPESLYTYKTWLMFLFAAGHEFGDDGRDLADTVSYDPGEITDAKWASCIGDRDNPTTLRSIMDWAKKRGWPGSVRPSMEAMFGGTTYQAPDGALKQITIAPPPPPRDLIQSSGEFVRGFVPPSYLLEGVLQNGFVYSLTARTGIGKTAVAMLLAGHVATGRPLGGLEVAKGSVLYFAAENSTDIQMRWLGVTFEMRLNPDDVDVHFLPGATPLSQIADRISEEVTRKKLAPSLVVIDTSAALSEAADDVRSVEMFENHAGQGLL